MRLIPALITSGLIAIPCIPCHSALVQWSASVGGNNNWYGLTTARYSWLEAEAFAVSQGGHLVSITSAEEQNFIMTQFFSGANDRLVAWMGISDHLVEGDYRWTSGEPITYSNWAGGEPNDFGGEEYGVINWHYGNYSPGNPVGNWNDAHLYGTWTDYNPSQVFPYFGLYEIQGEAPAAVPEPQSASFAVGLLGLWTWSLRRRPRILSDSDAPRTK